MGIPLGWPTPLEVEMEVGGSGGGGGWGVCPHGRYSNPPPCAFGLVAPPPPSGEYRLGWDRGASPLCADFSQGSPHIWGMVCVGCVRNFCQGSPLRGEIVRVWGPP